MKRALISIAVVLASSNTSAWAGHGAHGHSHHRHCKETSDVLGRSVCRRFGTSWAMPSWVPSFGLELGVSMRRMPTVAPDPDPQQSARVVTPPPNSFSTVAPELRLGVDITRNWYLMTLASVGLARSGDMVIDYGGGIGFRTFIADKTAVGLELAGGKRSYLLGRNRDRAEGEPLFSATKDTVFLDARVRAERWLNPWLAAGVWVGSSVIERGDVSAGIFLSAWSRSYRRR